MFVFSFCFDRYVYVYLIYKWKYLTSVQWRYIYKHKWRKTLFEHKYSTMAQHRQTIWPKLIRMIIDDNLLRWKRNECCRCDLLLLLGITWWIIQPTIIGFRIDSIEKIDFHVLLKENSMTFVCFFSYDLRTTTTFVASRWRTSKMHFCTWPSVFICRQRRRSATDKTKQNFLSLLVQRLEHTECVESS